MAFVQTQKCNLSFGLTAAQTAHSTLFVYKKKATSSSRSTTEVEGNLEVLLFDALA